ncbi:MAG: sigma-70 family RNA polymerase sigma factor [Candidatus Sericytochromatia bacterium]|nr:sigma-70 family RNA polymerase sigma factor [Candidatus Tanganyikabacteria bacterium]
MSDVLLDTLVGKARRGDERAWRDLYRRLIPRMREAAAGFPGLDLDNLVHEVFLTCYVKAFPGYRGGSLVAYVTRAVRNRCIDETRRRYHADLPLDAVADPVERTVPGPEERVVNRDLIAWALRHARVSAADQALLWLESAGWSHAEIARREAMTAGQVAVRLHRARKRLRAAHHRIRAGTGMLASACRPSPSSSHKTSLASLRQPPSPSPKIRESAEAPCALRQSSRPHCGRRSAARASTSWTPAASIYTSGATSAE